MSETETPADGGRPLIQVGVFLDYVCPFCHIGSARLLRLGERFDLRVNWMFIELRPETPPEGQGLDTLPYSEAEFEVMNRSLAELAAEEGLALARDRRLANSHRALLLAEAAKSLGREPFYRLHRRLFESHFARARNIGDESVLRDIVAACGLPDSLPDQAWSDPSLETRLAHYRQIAARHAISSVPTYIFGDRVLSGVQPFEAFEDAARSISSG
ncbi:DsbA family oxidoreductase [Acidihalobacter prosperus]|uniref:DSBA-like thioredoxin domain-containing protein n=1 Tax=Acidihalobacter prosperus TaxID=160660 RepID=A0A1A6C6D7_9GAMM|nr:DsbA family protein [Acidihalobacter prosperus]OBS10121.1 hypothetical protein Thpro_021171 [Acidihalobacter prosperus]